MFRKDSAGEYLEEQLSSGAVQCYRRRRVLGKGGFAKCYEVTEEQSGVRYACKVIDKDQLCNSQLKQKLQTEIQIHRKLSHSSIVKFYRVFQDDKHIYILLQLCVNNTLNELLKRRKVLSEIEVRFYLQQLLEALKYLHKLKIVHRDLKLDNFFLGDNLEIKIGDFGLAAQIGYQPRKTICGTPNYIAPEILQTKNGYSFQVDVWSLGVATYLMLYGHYPFQNSDSKSLTSRINAKTYLINPCLSDISKSFISRMLQVKPHDRWTVKQLLQHQFFTYFQIPKALPRSSLACPLNSNFLDQFKLKKTMKHELKQDEQFNFIFESKESHSSPRGKHSSIHQSMSASKILKLNKQENLPYIFSQKKLSSFRDSNPIQLKSSCKIKEWILQWWEHPKYGLMYHSSDGNFGFRYNDGTNVKSHPFPHKFTLIFKDGQRLLISGKDIKSGHVNKIYLWKLKIFNEMITKLGGKSDQNEEGIYVRMYVNYLDLFLLWLSNGYLQCRFEDKSELLIGEQFCVYIKSNKITVIFQSRELQLQNEEITSKYQKLSSVLAKIGSIKDVKSKENCSEETNKLE